MASDMAACLLERHEEEQIAVVGMACKLPGADDVEEFWRVLLQAESQHQELPNNRFARAAHGVEGAGRQCWYGNLVDDPAAFDHRFFKMSPREAASTDPQQRLMLQVAYQTLEQSGYFNSSRYSESSVGCYMGLTCVDYDDHIACSEPNAYSAVGNLKTFLAGRISHHFGWTGPALTIDTACSSSAVAIAHACRAILRGDCHSALAGGANLLFSPFWFRNLAAASFLSRTGQCKPFDAAADGYCRADGVAAVYLKKLSSALKDGDQILGNLSSTVVMQNENSTPIFVPNSPSLCDLFTQVVSEAQLEPDQISYIETHGTGTAVGDPAEYTAMKRVFGGSRRRKSKALLYGSMKGVLGHSESASGVVALIKVLLMIQKGLIPPQASFTRLNPNIDAQPSDGIELNIASKPWLGNLRAALVNNYGASGSNASMVITQAPTTQCDASQCNVMQEDAKQIMWLTALDKRAIKSYASRLSRFIDERVRNSNSSVDKHLLADISFNLSRQSNRSLPCSWICSPRSLEEFQQELSTLVSANGSMHLTKTVPPKPVVFCFGGQTQKVIGLSQQVLEIEVFRKHLNVCNAVIQSRGIPSIFPNICEQHIDQDVIHLQMMLFATQYASAKAWIDCGINPTAIIGHSFGELTGLCISGILSLEDTVKMIEIRARIIENHWGPDNGGMLAIEADEEEVYNILGEAAKLCPDGEPATIACYNGLKSFTLAGPTTAIDAVQDVLKRASLFPTVRFKRLNVTNAFHSALAEPLMERLTQSGQGVAFCRPEIHLETAISLDAAQQTFTPAYFARHVRYPVHFRRSVQKVADLYPQSVWLEIGSNSGVTAMAKKALGSVRQQGDHFQHIRISGGHDASQLADATANLWRQGIRVQYWKHHQLETNKHPLLFLPPYQFEKCNHWIAAASRSLPSGPMSDPRETETQTGLFTIMTHEGHRKSSARFRINVTSKKYASFTSGHKMARAAPICPATLQVDIAIEAIWSFRPELARHLPQLRRLENHSPICINASRAVFLDLEIDDERNPSWKWKIVSELPGGEKSILHASATLSFLPVHDEIYRNEFEKLCRLVQYRRCRQMLEATDPDTDIIQGRNIYRIFSDVVEYSDMYKGVKKLVGIGNESSACVSKTCSSETWFDTHVSDSFCQVAGIFVNCMTSRAESNLFVASGIDHWIRSPDWESVGRHLTNFAVYALHHRASEKMWISDVFVFDPSNERLLVAILGIKYREVSKSTMSGVLSRMSSGDNVDGGKSAVHTEGDGLSPAPSALDLSPRVQTRNKTSQRSDRTPSGIVTNIKAILRTLTGLDSDQVTEGSDLRDIGIDSLMSMELAREIQETFCCSIDPHKLAELTDVSSIIDCVRSTINSGHDPLEDLANSQYSQLTPAAKSSSAGYLSPSTEESVKNFRDESWSDVDVVSTDQNSTNAENTTRDFRLDQRLVLETFESARNETNQMVTDTRLTGYVDRILKKHSQLCIALTVEAFEIMGCHIRSKEQGAIINRVSVAPEMKLYGDFLHRMLATEARLIDLEGDKLVRTATKPPDESASHLFEVLLCSYPQYAHEFKTAYLIGSNLPGLLKGNLNAIELIRQQRGNVGITLASYAKPAIDDLSTKQIHFILENIMSSHQAGTGPIKVLGVDSDGAGLGAMVVGALLETDVPAIYSYCEEDDPLPAGTKAKLEGNPLVTLQTLDPRMIMMNAFPKSQHVIVFRSSACASHAQKDVVKYLNSTLRPDGVLILVERRSRINWVDFTLGACSSRLLPEKEPQDSATPPDLVWPKRLNAAGFGHIDWIASSSPESNAQRLIIALASGEQDVGCRNPAILEPKRRVKHEAREQAARAMIQKYTQAFSSSLNLNSNSDRTDNQHCVLVTGASGSVGAHLAAHLLTCSKVGKVLCINRRSGENCLKRQLESFRQKGIYITPDACRKLEVLETDTSAELLGLSSASYKHLLGQVTAVVHNAWPMSATRGLKGFTSQFKTLRNLVDFTRDAAKDPARTGRLSFQFISSIAAVGHFPSHHAGEYVPEQQVQMGDVLPNGYGEAKFICESIIDETLRQFPSSFRAMSVRLGQVAGSTKSGYWNPVEHLPFLVKSSQTLKLLPDLHGELSWVPVDEVATILGDLLLSEEADCPIYHIENPIRQAWTNVIQVLAKSFGIVPQGIVPFDEWIRQVEQFPGMTDDNPAIKVIEFLKTDFERMACGALRLDTSNTMEHSRSMAALSEIGTGLIELYIKVWRREQFLS